MGRLKPEALERWNRRCSSVSVSSRYKRGCGDGHPDLTLPMKFVADVMVGRLAKWLRFLGYDTLYLQEDDDRLLAIAEEEGRILLTRDTHFLKRRPTVRILFIQSDHLFEQLKQVIEELDLPTKGSGSRCLRCNVPLESLEKALVEDLVPDFVFKTHQVFSRCPACKRIYWPGSHFQRMQQALQHSILR